MANFILEFANMKYQLSQHAQDVIHERSILIMYLERVFDKPDLVMEDKNDEALEHRLGRIVEYENRVLRVIINKRVEPPLVITV